VTESAVAISTIDVDRIVRWYSGRSRDRVIEILPRVAASVTQGQWEAGLARIARSVLRRHVTSARSFVFIDKTDYAGGRVSLDRLYRLGSDGIRLRNAMKFAYFQSAFDLIEEARRAVTHHENAENAAVSLATKAALAWVEDFAPLAAAFSKLDAARPKPNYVFREISWTVFDNVSREMGLLFETVQMPDVRWTEREVIGKFGETTKIWVGEILWPEGTRHHTSRFASGAQCEACGHGIRSGHWIPLVLGAPGCPPKSLWVGRNCARHLFGCRMSGAAKDAIFERGPDPGGHDGADGVGGAAP